ncbi:flagellar hook-basal body protein [Paenibacillus sp. JX-17]|uniref:Flagellar hook-basal body protein n=1 Tax=Paenibacillus lacisoli TaxID=3064525 RepID=A0ABT9CD00_9BACL|nr:flagellar hook-basal body protein [Paenibacillus sp. JX-17]MDO7906534.1 flagellar hook-basal body protein [Paenibacillus sp. JX-17]
MLRGLYTAAAGMITQQRRHDTDTQNVANINTPGYKQVNSVQRSFPETLISMMGGNPDSPDRRIGKLNTGVFAEESLSTYLGGTVNETGQNTDFALVSDLRVTDPATGQPMAFDESGKYVSPDGQVTYKPEAFFTVQDEEGNIRYTKDGHFRVDGAGQLLSSLGDRVVDNTGNPITLTGGVSALKVNEQGQLVNALTGTPTGVNLGISVIDRPNQLVRQGEGNFMLDETDGAAARYMQAGDSVQIRQGYLEGSNVDTAQTMVDMTAALRAYEANQKVIQFYDKSLDKAVNEVGRV